MEVAACEREEEGDLVYRGMKLEIGGKNKGKKKSDYVIRDDIEIPGRDNIPLWMLGFRY